MDDYQRYHHYKKELQWLVEYQKLCQRGGKVDKEGLQKTLNKYQKKIDKMGSTFWFFKGKAIAVDHNTSDARQKMKGIIKKKSDKYRDQLVTQLTITFHPEWLTKKKRGSIEVNVLVCRAKINDGRITLPPQDKETSDFRFFYNRYELPHFKLGEMGEIALAAETQIFTNTVLGHYQYTEIQELMEDE